jgi:hypothetical protein
MGDADSWPQISLYLSRDRRLVDGAENTMFRLPFWISIPDPERHGLVVMVTARVEFVDQPAQRRTDALVVNGFQQAVVVMPGR